MTPDKRAQAVQAGCDDAHATDAELRKELSITLENIALISRGFEPERRKTAHMPRLTVIEGGKGHHDG